MDSAIGKQQFSAPLGSPSMSFLYNRIHIVKSLGIRYKCNADIICHQLVKRTKGKLRVCAATAVGGATLPLRLLSRSAPPTNKKKIPTAFAIGIFINAD